MANITPKSNGTYLIRISCGSDAAGKPISKSKIFKPSKPNLSYQKLNKEIDTFVKAFEEEIELYGIQERPDRIRFAEFCEKYLEVKKSTLAPTTYPFYENVVKEMLIPIPPYSEQERIVDALTAAFLTISASSVVVSMGFTALASTIAFTILGVNFSSP